MKKIAKMGLASLIAAGLMGCVNEEKRHETVEQVSHPTISEIRINHNQNDKPYNNNNSFLVEDIDGDGSLDLILVTFVPDGKPNTEPYLGSFDAYLAEGAHWSGTRSAPRRIIHFDSLPDRIWSVKPDHNAPYNLRWNTYDYAKKGMVVCRSDRRPDGSFTLPYIIEGPYPSKWVDGLGLVKK